MKVIDQNTWDRKEIFDLFSAADYPFYSITIPVDVTKVKEVSKNKGISFYYLMIWVCTKAVNSVPNFLLRVLSEKRFRTLSDHYDALGRRLYGVLPSRKGAE